MPSLTQAKAGGEEFHVMGLNVGWKIEKVDGKKLRYEDFVDLYMKANKPVVLTGLMGEWRASKEWVTHDGLPNLQFFTTHCADSTVQVADCGEKEFTYEKRIEMTVSNFIDQWPKYSNNHDDLFCNADEKSHLYLKDWHFIKEFPCYDAYVTPPFFTDDWLNMYLNIYHMHGDVGEPDDKYEINCSDYRFVYMGAKGTWTPLHADVFRSYSWSANVCGRKLWLLLPPAQCHLLFDRYNKNSVCNIFADVSDQKFPGFKETIWWECTQEKDEIIFVPSGWYHQVHNLEDTISINHNWFNGYNLFWVWNLLVKDYNEAKSYIEDIREISDDFEGLCQRNLAANSGMNFYDFFMFMARFSLANLIQLLHLKTNDHSCFTSGSVEVQCLAWNVVVIRNVLLKMRSAEAFAPENLQTYCAKNGLLFNIDKFLEEEQFRELYEVVGSTYGVNRDLASGLSTCPLFHCPKDKIREVFAKLYLGEVSSSATFDPEALVGLIGNVLDDICGKELSSSLKSEIMNLDISAVV